MTINRRAIIYTEYLWIVKCTNRNFHTREAAKYINATKCPRLFTFPALSLHNEDVVAISSQIKYYTIMYGHLYKGTVQNCKFWEWYEMNVWDMWLYIMFMHYIIYTADGSSKCNNNLESTPQFVSGENQST